MNKQKKFIEKFKSLSDGDRSLVQIIFHNTVDFDYDEIETENEIIPQITIKSTGEKHNIIDYIKDKTIVHNSTHWMMGLRRRN